MIEEGFLVHGAAECPLATLQFNYPILHSFLVAALTTILSYQALAILTDICLGLKSRSRRGTALLTDLGIMHFSEQASALAITTALFNNRFLTRLRYHGFRDRRNEDNFDGIHPPDHAYVRKGRLSPRVASKLLLLVAMAPMINIVSIILSLEKDTALSFSRAEFGGVALGLCPLSSDDCLRTSTRSGSCRQYDTKFAAGERSAVEFIVCAEQFVESIPINNTDVTVKVTGEASGVIALELATDPVRYRFPLSGTVRVGGEMYRLRQTVEKQLQDVGDFVAKVATVLAEDRCSNDESTISALEIEANAQQNDSGEEIEVSAKVPCLFLDTQGIILILAEMVGYVTLVPTENLQVLRITSEREVERFASGDGLSLVLRRRPYLSLAALVVAVAVVIVLKLAVGTATCNDTNLGFEVIVKAALGMKCFDSMLQERREVGYWEQ